MVSVQITGVGVVSAAGLDVPSTLRTFQAGSRSPGRVSLFETTLGSPVFEVTEIAVPESPSTPMRTVQLALVAVNEALELAGLRPPLASRRVGVCLGTSVACQLNDVDFYAGFKKHGSAPMTSVKRFLRGNLAETVAAAVGADGPCLTVANACSSGADAIGVALSWLRNGVCDIAIAGGADELNRIPFCGFNSLGIMSPEPCRPFDRERQGLNLGEGAGILLLESDRNGRDLARMSGLLLAGYSTFADAYHLTAPRPDGSGLEKSIRDALARASVDPGDVCFVNAHGTATRDNDKVEGEVLARVFGPDIDVISTKGYTGHTLGAAGGIEAVFTAVALEEGWIPASAGFERPDEEIPIRPVTRKKDIAGSCAVSTSLAFGGNNSTLVFRMQTNAWGQGEGRA